MRLCFVYVCHAETGFECVYTARVRVCVCVCSYCLGEMVVLFMTVCNYAPLSFHIYYILL